MRMEEPMSATARPGGGTMKSVALVPVPIAVVALRCPDAAAVGTVKVSAVVLVAVDVAVTPYNFTVVAPAEGSKDVPVTETVALASPLVGVKLVMVGAPATVT